MRTIKLSELDCDPKFVVPPANQGQMVTESYADLHDGRVLLRVYDSSDRSEEFYIADLDPDDDDALGINRSPNILGKWVRVSVTP